eukprot:TRINITY_DN30576_c0_g1_i1.p1 TRINITY_DN30576_c0_g1~~TRINITY_DN30576_c0_g1_i1.p1  ORF type:complete len:188 (+),score=68.17 TRINITY_DN30576_c0_g1_i1:88-651(+)
MAAAMACKKCGRGGTPQPLCHFKGVSGGTAVPGLAEDVLAHKACVATVPSTAARQQLGPTLYKRRADDIRSACGGHCAYGTIRLFLPGDIKRLLKDEAERKQRAHTDAMANDDAYAAKEARKELAAAVRELKSAEAGLAAARAELQKAEVRAAKAAAKVVDAKDKAAARKRKAAAEVPAAPAAKKAR